MKKWYVIFLSLILSQSSVLADEGMWIPSLIKSLNYSDMQAMGCKLSAEEIYSVNQSSLKDAIVQFGNGCTGEIISSTGLLLTNHHCGLGQIQQHSSVEHDYLQNGFWAYQTSEELSNPGLTVKFLVRIEDVTDQLIPALKEAKDEAERSKIIREKSLEIQKEATKDTHYDARVIPFYEGNEFYLYVYEIYKDVRLVGTPPWGIGKFGADTDNWMWPRHKGDFCLFRVYTAPDGSPAEYAPENIPMKPKHYLPVSTKGIQENDYAMILGYPGRTDRYLSSWGVDMLLTQSAPTIIDVRTIKLNIYRKYMDASNETFIQYASKQARVSNYWKYSIGQVKQLKNNHVIEKKQAREKAFASWVQADETRKNYQTCLRELEDGYTKLMQSNLADKYFVEAIYQGSEILPFAWQYANMAKNTKNQEELKTFVINYFKDYHAGLDEEVLAAMLLVFEQKVDPSFYPASFIKISKKAKANYTGFAKKLMEKSVFSSQEKMLALIESGNDFSKDPALQLITDFVLSYRERMKTTDAIQEGINRGERIFLAGLREMETNHLFSPDANSTMRLTYGKVCSYQPADAVSYSYYTTLDGVMEKDIPGNWEFSVPEKLKDLYAAKDYGPYANEKGELVVNYITDNDITGGNSGSPVIDGNGNLIGCAFDGNWEAMSGDISFEKEVQRTIVLDSRYILFVIDKLAGAQNLINELTLVR